MNRPSPFKQLAEAFQSLPASLASFVIGILIAVIVDPILLALLFGSVAVGLKTDVVTAVAVFFLVYVLIRTINTVANAIGRLAQSNTRAQYNPAPPVFDEPASEPVLPLN